MAHSLALLSGVRRVTVPWPEWPILGDADVLAVHKVLESRQLSVLRKEGVVAEFEDAFAAKMRVRYALSFASGTASLHAACFACGVGPGVEVLTPSYTWLSAITAILHANGTPIFCDVAPNAFHIDPREIVRKATPRTKAVIVCHTWGIPAPMDQIMDAARERNLKVIEDASHAHGGKYRDLFLGTVGDVGCFSLQGTKALVAGEGGVLVTNDQLFYERSMIPGHHNARLKDSLTLPDTVDFAAAGGSWKYRAAPLSMAIANAQLLHLDQWNAAKEANHSRLESRLRNIPFLAFPRLPDGSVRGFYGSPCRYTYEQERVSRDTFIEALAAEGVRVFAGYDNWYLTPLFQDLSLFRQMWIDRHFNGTCYRPLAPGALSNTDRVVRQTLVFPSWGQPANALIDQYVEAFQNVTTHMDELADYQSATRERGDRA